MKNKNVMKSIFQIVFLLLPFLSAAQSIVPYKKKVPIISNKGVITMPDGKTKLQIEGFSDKETAIFFLVRHAEKDTTGGSNADLNNIGKGRANALVKIFKKISIHKIASTNTPRTKNTAQPLAKFKHRQVEIYDAKKQKDFIESLVNIEKGHKVFVVGHSNTVPQLAQYTEGG